VSIPKTKAVVEKIFKNLKFEYPNILIEMRSLLFFNLIKTSIDVKKIINGNISTNILGMTIKDNPIGIEIFTSNFLKKFISSNKFIIKPRAIKTKITFKKLFKN
tara:strand:+ start:49 stop:360 length:312 start_codon:yes stop_codon:yes gene_type:complete